MTDLGSSGGGDYNFIRALAKRTKIDLIVKCNGVNDGACALNCDRGQDSQLYHWACGVGIPTYLMPQAVISLASLASGTFFPQKTAPSPYELLTCSARCPVVTPYHQIASDIEKLLTNNHSHSWTCSDTGQAIHMYSVYPKLSLHAGQLTSYGFVEQRLQAQADYYRNIYINVSACSVPACDVGHLRHIRDTLYSNYHLSRLVEQFVDVGKRLHFRSPRIILRTVHTGVIECSSEALTDFAAGVTTHSPSSHASAEFAKQVLQDAGFQGEIIYPSSP